MREKGSDERNACCIPWKNKTRYRIHACARAYFISAATNLPCSPSSRGEPEFGDCTKDGLTVFPEESGIMAKRAWNRKENEDEQRKESDVAFEGFANAPAPRLFLLTFNQLCSARGNSSRFVLLKAIVLGNFVNFYRGEINGFQRDCLSVLNYLSYRILCRALLTECKHDATRALFRFTLQTCTSPLKFDY